jgi:hypothetical protein
MPLVFGEVDTPDVTSGGLRGVATPLVRVPIDTLGYETSGTISLGANPRNPDGSVSYITLNQGAGPSGAVQYFRQRLGGRVVGVRWLSNDPTTTASPFFDVVIDGEPFAVDRGPLRMDNVAVTAGRSDIAAQHIVAADLPDRSHTVTVVVSPDASGGSSRRIDVYGFIAEQGRYSAPPAPERASYVAQSTTLGTTAASVPYNTQIVALRWRNTDTASRIVTVYMPSGTATADTYTTRTIAAGAEDSVAFPRARSGSGWKWKADAAGVVYGIVEEA